MRRHADTPSRPAALPPPPAPAGVSAEFIVNGMQHALGALGVPGARVPGLWRYEPVVNHELRQVRLGGLGAGAGSAACFCLGPGAGRSSTRNAAQVS